MAAPDPLDVQSLYTQCDIGELTFDTTAELEDLDEVIGQPRALSALEYGIHVKGDDCNIYALGPAGIRKHAVVKQILEKEAVKRPVSSDWCYVYNFSQPHKPNALELPPSRGSKLCNDMEQLIEDLGTAIPAAFETEEYQSRIEELERDFIARRDKMLEELSEEASQRNIRFLHTPSGFAFAPLDKRGEVINPEEFKRLHDSDKEKIESDVEDLQKKLQKIIRQIPIWQKETREKVKEIDREIARYAVEHLITVIKENHRDLPEVCKYLDEVEQDVVDHVREFRQDGETQALLLGRPTKVEALRRYKVNVVVDHDKEASAASVIYQDLPTYTNLVGRIEYQAQMGTLITDFTMIKAGDLHRANGGYLILDAIRILRQPFAWEGLKRALRAREIRIEPLEKAYGLMSTSSLEPEPIPLDVKVVLVGDRLLYYLLNQYDPDFPDLFKVAADFNEDMERDDNSSMLFARLIANVVKEEGLLPLDRDAVARVIEHSSKLAEDAKKLSINLRGITDLLKETDYRANKSGKSKIERDDVQAAIDSRVYRHDRIRERAYEAVERGIIKIDTDSKQVGQINGLSVINLGDFSFGQPSRITVTTRLGEGKFVDIQRETKLGGNIHSKGVLILTHYLASQYARDYPLSLSASIVFEQSYGMVEGDSASLAELCALLSALSNVPIRQGFAVTGSVNQRGEVQAIGGVNQKVEGFFDICSLNGLNGQQAVIIPSANVPHLMLREDVVESAAQGRFKVYSVDNVNEAIELLTGITAGGRDESGALPPDSVNAKVEQALIDLAVRRKEFGRAHRDDENNANETNV
ncbi:MAG: ATP-binding protein [Arenicellales bacterium]|nr:ATP-binding protein [Arenicellales bacterium]